MQRLWPKLSSGYCLTKTSTGRFARQLGARVTSDRCKYSSRLVWHMRFRFGDAGSNRGTKPGLYFAHFILFLGFHLPLGDRAFDTAPETRSRPQPRTTSMAGAADRGFR